MDAVSRQPSKWEDLEHFHMTHDFLWGVGTYLGQHAKNKNLVKIHLGKNKTTKTGDVSRKKARTATFFVVTSIKKGRQ